MKNLRPVLAVIAAGILWGIISVFIKALSAAGLDALQITCIRMIVAAPVFTAVIALKDKEKLKIRLRDIWMFIGTGIISIVLFNILYFYTMISSQASVAVVLLYTSPVFIMILSALFFREKITAVKLSAVIMTVVGCALVSGFVGGSYTITPLILLTGLGSGLFYGLYTIFGRAALSKYDTMTVTTYTFIMGLIGSLPIGRPLDIAEKISADPALILWCLGIGIFCTVLPYFLYTWGLKEMESAKAAVLVAVEPLVGTAIGMLFYNENADIPKIVGIAVILAAIIILNLPSRKAAETDIT